jgi:hypothetical protein
MIVKGNKLSILVLVSVIFSGAFGGKWLSFVLSIVARKRITKKLMRSN